MPENWWLLCCGAGPIILAMFLVFFSGTPRNDDDGAGEAVKGGEAGERSDLHP